MKAKITTLLPIFNGEAFILWQSHTCKQCILFIMHLQQPLSLAFPNPRYSWHIPLRTSGPLPFQIRNQLSLRRLPAMLTDPFTLILYRNLWVPWPCQVRKTGFHCAPTYPPALHSFCPSSTMLPEPWAVSKMFTEPWAVSEMFPEPWAAGMMFPEPWAVGETSHLGLNTPDTLILSTSTTYESQLTIKRRFSGQGWGQY